MAEWHEGSGQAGFKTDGTINAAFFLTPIIDPRDRSYGDSQDTIPVPRNHLPLLNPNDER